MEKMYLVKHVVPAQPGFEVLSLNFEEFDRAEDIVASALYRETVIAWGIRENGSAEAITIDGTGDGDGMATALKDANGWIVEPGYRRFPNLDSWLQALQGEWRERKKKQNAS